MKNTIIYTMTASLALLLTACTETTEIRPTGDDTKTFIDVSSEKVVFDADGGSVAIVVATNAKDWEYDSQGDWFSVTRQDDNTLLVDASINAGAATLTGRIAVSCMSDEASLTQEIAIVQRAERSVDLSAAGRANCYIARTGGVYKFDATVKGNGGGDGRSEYAEAYGLSIEGAAYADLLWESRHDGDKTMSCGIIDGSPVYRGGYVSFSTGRSEGNAVIALKDINDNILWSWHIWVCDNEITTHDHIDSEGNVAARIMDRNLGALNNTPMDVGNRGMFYEWGRKDPFLPTRSPYYADTDGNNLPAYNKENTSVGNGSGTWIYNGSARILPTPPGNIPFTVQHPMTYLQVSGHGDWYCYGGQDEAATHPGLWGDKKTIFDPCPPGYKVPGADLYGIPAGNSSISTGGSPDEYDENGLSDSYYWNACKDLGRCWRNTGDYYPMVGNIYYSDYLDITISNYSGGMAFYWTSQESADMTKSSAYYLRFNRNWCYCQLGAHDCAAQIRCVKE